MFDVLEWLAAICPHVPNKGEQMFRYYGYHSNVSLGKRKKILKELGLWDRKARPPPKATKPPKVQEYSIDYSLSQIPESTRRLSGGFDKWLYAKDHVFSLIDPKYAEVYPPVEGHIA